LLLLINLIFSHDTDMHVSHDFSDGGHDTDGSHGPSIFSVRMISLLMVGFGALSFGVRATTDASMFVASMAGIGGAVVIGGVGYTIIRAFYASQASSTITEQDLIGSQATLLDGIPEKGYGQIACVLRGREITYLAMSKDGRTIPRGAQVRVTGKSGNAVIVEAIN
jgi:membrane-bound ClpP family serine protease